MVERASMMRWVLGLGAMLFAVGAPAIAAAQCCAPPPPSCCAPPPPPPPSQPPCCTPGHNVNIPGINVSVSPTVVVNANVQARASASAQAGATGTVFVGGGAQTWFTPPVATGVINGLNVDGGRRAKRTAYQATRTAEKRVFIQAVCIDDRMTPHPASQIRPDRDIDAAYDGELYRCIAGTRLQATFADFHEKADFSGGKTLACAKGEALYHGAGGKVECRPAKPQRDCFERSLLRRFGAGLKVLTMRITETYTAYREEEETVETVSTSMSLDGGVGGVAY